MNEFIARRVGVAEMLEDDTFVVVLADDPSGEGSTAEFQRSMSGTYSDEDRRNGFDTYCIVSPDGAVHYGGVMQWKLLRDELTLCFDAAAAHAFNVDGEVMIALEIDESSWRDLRSGLERVFGSRPSSR